MKFVCVPVSDNGENGLSDEGADGGNARQNFGARTAADSMLPPCWARNTATFVWAALPSGFSGASFVCDSVPDLELSCCLSW